MTPKPVDAWAIVDPEEGIVFVSLGTKRVDTIKEWKGASYWRYWHSQGFRCIPVTVAPKEKGRKP